MTRWLTRLGIVLALATNGAAKVFPPETLLQPVLGGGWSLRGRPVAYSPERLFEYIDGEAEHFLAYGLVGTAVGVYAATPSGQRGPTPERKVTVDVYDMGNSAQAFGIYSSMRSGDVQIVNVGAQGYLAGPVLDFWKGRYFVHVSAGTAFPGFEKAAVAIGRDLSADIRGPSRMPQVCTLLPTKGRVTHSLKWYRSNFLGHAFLTNVAVATYARRHTRPRLFVGAYKTETAAKQVLRKYARAVVPRAKPVPVPADLPENTVAVVQPYYDTILVTQVGSFVTGVLKAPDCRAAASLLKPLLESLERERKRGK